jgi:hypothetical protein
MPQVYLYRMAFLGRATGQRRSDLVKMRPTDLTADGINVRIQKLRGKPHMVPLTKAQMAEIRSWPVRDLQFFIMSPAGKKCSATYLNELWYNWRTSETARPIREMKMTIHGLRSTAINDRRREGATDGGIADELCMSAKMVSRYLRFADKVESGRASRDRREQSRPNLQTRRSICKHSGAKMLKKLAFQKTYLIGHQRRKFPSFRTWMPATSTGMTNQNCSVAMRNNGPICKTPGWTGGHENRDNPGFSLTQL